MKKFWLSLGLTLILAGWCGAGYYGFGASAAFGQYMSCNPNDPYCYNDYYAAPYADPLSQLLYYIAPPVVVEPERRYEPRQRYERQEPNRGRGERERRGPSQQERGR
jgi:hypothetical protein